MSDMISTNGATAQFDEIRAMREADEAYLALMERYGVDLDADDGGEYGEYLGGQ